MTASTVNGHPVVSDEPTLSPLSTPEHPIEWAQTRTLTLDDGTKLFGCVHCDFVSPRVGTIRPHLGKCPNKPRPAPPSRAVAQVRASPGRTVPTPPEFPEPDRLITKVIEQLSALPRTASERDYWHDRADKAEAALKKLFDALGVHP